MGKVEMSHLSGYHRQDEDTVGKPRERGARRQKLAGYLKQANELRQSYQQSYGWRQNDGPTDEDGSSMPGSFPELISARNGDEELVLFPSYARRHHPRSRSQQVPGFNQDIRSERGTGDAEYWHKEWERHEDDTALIDVDVRGWIYAPHRGPMGRKNRMIVGLARHLSGVPAPSTNSRDSSPQSSIHRKVEARATKQEEEAVGRAADDIKRRGEGEAQIASKGGYSEAPGSGSEHSSGFSPVPSRTPSPDNRAERNPLRSSKGYLYEDNGQEPGSLAKRASWNHPSDMSPAELQQANAHLMVRLKPFLTTPLPNVTLTVFFYNDSTSKSRTVQTDDSGHFTLRAALDFIPTHVRVLASDKLSATNDVKVIETKGVSVISDIDDTIKHSAIGSGAKEIFRNTFIRELGDLTIEGVKEWYSKMADMGVTFHYVSNSPWQIFPLLMNFFSLAGLPQGSFHLKQYNGMLQGIFEPVAERKKGTLEKIMNDFPQRRFILIGDSGEADLELYTDVVLSNPGRVLGVFIRDVTTSLNKGFFDSASLAPLRKRGSQSPVRGRSLANGGSLWSRKSMSDLKERPPLPPRPGSRAVHSDTGDNGHDPAVGKLIDLDDNEPLVQHRAATPQASPEPSVTRRSPPRPIKPNSLRTPLDEFPPSAFPHRSKPPATLPSRKPPTPLPKPQHFAPTTNDTPRQPSPLSQTHPVPLSPPLSVRSRTSSLERQKGYRSAAKSKITSAYNALPSLYNSAQVVGASRGSQIPLTNDRASTDKKRPPPPIPPRRGISSYPVVAAQYASTYISNGWNGESDDNSRNGNGSGNGSDSYDSAPLSKKEELWNRRWTRAQEIFREKRVVLKAWRRGEDVMIDAIRLVKKAKSDENGGGSGDSGSQ